MHSLPRLGLACLLIVTALAGCADGAESTENDEGPGVGATATTGGIRGVVVDNAIVPIPGVSVRLQDTELATQTDQDGLFVFSGLEPGTYFVEATHPFYSTQQASTVVKAGVDRPDALRIQLTQIIFDEPQMVPLYLEGYIFCSSNSPVGLSEECGEGVGSPESTCSIPEALLDDCYGIPDVDNPIMPGERLGKNPSNMPGQEWHVEVPGMVTMIVEQSWKPSVSVGVGGQNGAFRTFVSENWVCDPFCREDYEFNGGRGTVSSSPMYIRVDMSDHKDYTYNATTRFTSFTYAGDETGVLLEQPYDLFVHTFHLLPAPEGWSIANGDENPFKV